MQAPVVSTCAEELVKRRKEAVIRPKAVGIGSEAVINSVLLLRWYLLDP